MVSIIVLKSWNVCYFAFLNNHFLLPYWLIINHSLTHSLTHNSLSGEVLLLWLVVKPLIANDGRDGWLIVIIAL